MLKTRVCGDFLEDLVQKSFAVFDDPLPLARGAKMAAFALKRQEIFAAAIVASNPGEAASQVAAVQVSIDHGSYIKVAGIRIGAHANRSKSFPVARNGFPRSCRTRCTWGCKAC